MAGMAVRWVTVGSKDSQPVARTGDTSQDHRGSACRSPVKELFYHQRDFERVDLLHFLLDQRGQLLRFFGRGFEDQLAVLTYKDRRLAFFP
jgi:hypothetical protein